MFFSFPICGFPQFRTRLFLRAFKRVEQVVRSCRVASFVSTVFIFYRRSHYFFRACRLGRFVENSVNRYLCFNGRAQATSAWFFNRRVCKWFQVKRVLFCSFVRANGRLIIREVVNGTIRQGRQRLQRFLARRVARICRVLSAYFRMLRKREFLCMNVYAAVRAFCLKINVYLNH